MTFGGTIIKRQLKLPLFVVKSFKVKTTGETGGLHSPYKGQLQAEPLKGAQKV